MSIANLKSIPKSMPTKEQRFTQGALRSSVLAPRGHGYYDAFAHSPDSAVLASQVGAVTTMQGHARLSIPGEPTVTATYALPAAPVAAGGSAAQLTTTYQGNSKLLVFNPSSSDGNVGWLLYPKSDGTMSKTVISLPQLSDLGPTRSGAHMYPGTGVGTVNNTLSAQTSSAIDAHHRDGDPSTVDPDPGRRVENIPLRLSVRIRNVTEALSVGGMVRILRYNGGLVFSSDSITQLSGTDGAVHHDAQTIAGTAAPGQSDAEHMHIPSIFAYKAVTEMVRNAQRTKHMGAHELANSHQTNSYPADFIRSLTFESDITFEEGCATPSYSTILILIDDFESSVGSGGGGKNNTYEVNVVAQKAGRFSPGTLLYSKSLCLRHDTNRSHTERLNEERRDPARRITLPSSYDYNGGGIG